MFLFEGEKRPVRLSPCGQGRSPARLVAKYCIEFILYFFDFYSFELNLCLDRMKLGGSVLNVVHSTDRGL